MLFFSKNHNLQMQSTYKNIIEIRRDNLRIIVSRYASTAAAAKALKRSEPQLNNLLAGRENIGNALSRKLEELSGDPPGWLDSPAPDARALARAVVQILELSKTVANPDPDLLAEQVAELYQAELANKPIDKTQLLRKYTALTHSLLKK